MSTIALLLALTIAIPVLRAPSERVFGMETVGRHHDPFTAMSHFDGPIAPRIYWQPVTDVPGALLARAWGPVAAYNWLVLLTFPLSAAAAYLLARHLGLSAAAAGIAAIVVAFSPFHLAQSAYHPHVAQTQWIPLYLFALWRCLEKADATSIGILVASIGGVALSNFYGGLIALAVTPVAVSAYWMFKTRTRPGGSRACAITVATLAAAALGAIAYAAIFARPVLENRSAFAFPRSEIARYSAHWWSYLVPPVAHPLLGEFAERVWHGADVHRTLLEQQVTLGSGLILLSLVAIGAWIARNRHPRSIVTVPILLAVGIVAFVCSVSPPILYSMLPMFRSYARFGVVVHLMIALLAGIGAERLWASGRRAAKVACVGLLALAAAEYAVWPPALSRDVLPTTAHRWVARQAGDLHALDCAKSTAESQSVPWLSRYRISVRGGWLDDCREPNLADKLSAAGYTHLLVRQSSVEAPWFAQPRHQNGLMVASSFADGTVFAITAPKPSVYTAQMTGFRSREYDGKWTSRWMGPSGSWSVVNRTGRSVDASVDIEMRAARRHRRMAVRLDGRQVQTLLITRERRSYTVGPLVLASGVHELLFQPMDSPAAADDRGEDDVRSQLTFAVGAWSWRVRDEQP